MSSQRAPGWQKRVDHQKENANKNLTSWFLKTFSSGKKTQYLRDQDEASALAERQQRRPAGASPTQGLGQLSAVANAAHGHGGSRRGDNERRTPQRQRSFLRQQLMEMKRQSAETLLRKQQQRMDGEITEEDLAALDAEQRFSDDEDDEDEFDSDAETVQEVDEALGNLRLSSIDAPDPAASTSSMTSSTQVRSRRSSSAASNSSAGKRRSTKKLSQRSNSARSDDAKDSELTDGELAEREQRAEYSLEVSRRLSQATQLYAEAINALDSALNPEEYYRRQPMPEPQPLLLGNKKSSKNEWI